MTTRAAQSTTSTDGQVLLAIDWKALGHRVANEVGQRQIHAPVVSTYRWWARRPHCVMGAILDAAVDKYGADVVVSDPFSGGGTVSFEAVRRGIRAYAQDIHAWPSKGLGVAMRYCDPTALRKAAESLVNALQPLRQSYRTKRGSELSHIIRVRSVQCADCNKRSFLFASPLISLKSRSTAERHAYFGCAVCGAVTEGKRKARAFTCCQCNARFSATHSLGGCVHCGSSNVGRSVLWHPVLVQELIVDGNRLRPFLRPVRPGDPVDSLPASEEHPALAQSIQQGIETRRLLDSGFTSWGALYTARQARTLIQALDKVRSMRASCVVKDRLAFAIVGAAEMPAFLSRWDRFHLKAFEGTANHRYSNSDIAVEANLLSPVGRGTIPRRLRAASVALDWLVEAGPRFPRVRTQSSVNGVRRSSDWDVLIVTGSSRSQALPARSVNIVITDPPYFDDVQYGELARLFHTWLKVYWPRTRVDESDEAVPNRQRGTTALDYEATIAACLTECRRTLRRDGRLVLTFHNKKLAAWHALAGALKTAGFVVDALAVVLAENAADHCKRTVNAMLHDLVIECVPARQKKKKASSALVAFQPRTLAEKNLAAMGLAVADCVQSPSTVDLAEAFGRRLSELRAKEALIS